MNRSISSLGRSPVPVKYIVASTVSGASALKR